MMSEENMNVVQKQILKLNTCAPITYNNGHHMKAAFEALQSLRKDEILCDIRIETDDGTIIFGHKVVLVTVSPYFRAMFTRFPESNKDHVTIRELDSSTLQLLINYIYTGEIMVTEEKVEDLLPAANILQLDYVKDACIKFLQTQLNPSNCLGIKELADLHDCNDLLSSIEKYIKKQFLEVIKYEEFLTLSSEELIKLISSNEPNIWIEEKFVWVIDGKGPGPNDLTTRSVEMLDISLKPPCWVAKVDLLVSRSHFGVGILNNCIYAVGGCDFTSVINTTGNYLNSVEVFDVNIQQWKMVSSMSSERSNLGVGVLDNLLYAVGGFNSSSILRSVECYNPRVDTWTPIAEMSECRSGASVVVLGAVALDGLLYVIGGRNDSNTDVESVEIYKPKTNTWSMKSLKTLSNSAISMYGAEVVNKPTNFKNNQ